MESCNCLDSGKIIQKERHSTATDMNCSTQYYLLMTHSFVCTRPILFNLIYTVFIMIKRIREMS